MQSLLLLHRQPIEQCQRQLGLRRGALHEGFGPSPLEDKHMMGDVPAKSGSIRLRATFSLHYFVTGELHTKRLSKASIQESERVALTGKLNCRWLRWLRSNQFSSSKYERTPLMTQLAVPS
jgi:hypothetical protein